MAETSAISLNQDVSKLGRLGDLVEVALAMLMLSNSPKLAVQLRVFSSKLNAEEQERQRQLELSKQAQELKTLWRKVAASL